MLKNDYSLAEIGFDTAENERCQVLNIFKFYPARDLNFAIAPRPFQELRTTDDVWFLLSGSLSLGLKKRQFGLLRGQSFLVVRDVRSFIYHRDFGFWRF